MQINSLDILYIHARSLPNMSAFAPPVTPGGFRPLHFLCVPQHLPPHGIYARLSAIS